jgi:hypothetical protein
MAVMARESWTDERLDDLNHRVDRGFDQVDRRFDSVDRRFDSVDRRFEEVGVEFRTMRSEMGAQFAAQQRMMIQLAGGMFATMVIGFLGVIATILIQT